MTLKQFDISVENKPGEVARIAELLAKRAVNIRGIATDFGKGHPMIHVITDDDATTRSALTASGTEFMEKEIIVVTQRYATIEEPTQGDLHTIGYGLVSTQLELAGFEVHKLGIDLDSMYFIEKAKEHNADIIGLSAFLVTTIPYCPEVLAYLCDMGLRDKYKLIIGGTECTADKADAMDADGWALNAVAAVPLCKRLMGKDVGEEAKLATGYNHPWWYNSRRN